MDDGTIWFERSEGLHSHVPSGGKKQVLLATAKCKDMALGGVRTRDKHKKNYEDEGNDHRHPEHHV